MSTVAHSTFQLTPPSAAFVAHRVDTLGPWVLGAFLDCMLMGIILCQALTFFRTRSQEQTAFQKYCFWLVVVVLTLSTLKTFQLMAVVWVQNVNDFANPDVARLRVATAWWQVTLPLMTGIIGFTVQSFFCLRYYLLSRNIYLVALIVCSMSLGLAAIVLTLHFILAVNVKAKVLWLLIHLVGVFVADALITAGTFFSLRKRSSGLHRTNQIINRLVRMMFESAIPPTVIAFIDLIMTQTLGPKLLWHLLLNFSLGKMYCISLLYTLNCINGYRRRPGDALSDEVYAASSSGRGMISRRNNAELGLGSKASQIYVQTRISTYVSPATAERDQAGSELQMRDDK
ncbi:hypothetical protein C8R46DRAFT_376992 [Mycena filopes]|nr:hypothetical protein C8R46DRAFT_376992 [Mycena filopes]